VVAALAVADPGADVPDPCAGQDYRPIYGVHSIDFWATLLEFGGLGVYLFFASRTFYGDKLPAGLAKAVVLTFCGFGLFDVYRLLLFFTVLYST